MGLKGEMLEISEFCLLLGEPVSYKDRGSSGCSGRVWHFSNPENIALNAADKTWAGYYFGLEDCVPLLALLRGYRSHLGEQVDQL